MAVVTSADHLVKGGESGAFEPQRKNHWVFEAVLEDKDDAELITLSVDSSSLPKESNDEGEFQWLNHKIHFAGEFHMEAIPLVLKDFVDQDVVGVIRRWREKIIDYSNGAIRLASDYKKTCHLILYAPDGSHERKWTLHGCWPTEVDWGGELSFEDGENTKIEAQIRYDFAEPEFSIESNTSTTPLTNSTPEGVGANQVTTEQQTASNARAEVVNEVEDEIEAADEVVDSSNAMQDLSTTSDPTSIASDSVDNLLGRKLTKETADTLKDKTSALASVSSIGGEITSAMGSVRDSINDILTYPTRFTDLQSTLSGTVTDLSSKLTSAVKGFTSRASNVTTLFDYVDTNLKVGSTMSESLYNAVSGLDTEVGILSSANTIAAAGFDTALDIVQNDLSVADSLVKVQQWTSMPDFSATLRSEDIAGNNAASRAIDLQASLTLVSKGNYSSYNRLISERESRLKTTLFTKYNIGG